MNKFYLMTKLNNNGKLVFAKKRFGNSFLYCATDGYSYVYKSKKEVVDNLNMYSNIGVYGNSIFPIEASSVPTLNPIEYVLFKYSQVKNDSSFSPVNIILDIIDVNQGRNCFFYIIRSAMSVYVDLMKLGAVRSFDIQMQGWSDNDYNRCFVDLCYNALNLRGEYRSPDGVLAAVEDMIIGSDYSDSELSTKTTKEDAVKVVANILKHSFEDYANTLEEDMDELLECTKAFAYDMRKLLCDLRDILVGLRKMEYQAVAEEFDLNWEFLVDIIQKDKEHCKAMKRRKNIT